ncbi:alpha/beta hydrolase [Leifsonia xyli]|uniref:alpha/beta hydrolase n=1 Tax=Leifsonia xyli TaxID=1575 RepID=UPI00178C310D|nr:alpha/beta hydrolase [Leifsonia xyli]
MASAFEAAGKGTLGDFDVMLVVNARHPEELSKLLLGGTLTQAQIAATWAALTKSTDFYAEKFIEKHSFELASLDGLPFSVMSQAGKHELNYALDPEHPENLEKAFARMGFLPGERSMKDFKADLEAIQTAFTRAQSTTKEGDVFQLVSFGRHDGVVTAGISMGDLDTASKIGVFVSGMMSDVHGLGDSFDAFKKIRDGYPGIAMVTWVGYRSPNLAEEAFQDRANKGAPRLASFLDGIAAQRAGNPIDRFVTIGHSYGTNMLAEALKIAKAPVDAYVTLGSAGLQYGTTAQDLGAKEIYATHADGDGIAAGVGQHVHFRKASEDGGGYDYQARVDPRDLDGAYEFSSEKDGGGKAVTMHNLLNPIDTPEWMQNLDGIPADQEIGYLNEKSSTVLGLHTIMRGKTPAQ